MLLLNGTLQSEEKHKSISCRNTIEEKRDEKKQKIKEEKNNSSENE